MNFGGVDRTAVESSSETLLSRSQRSTLGCFSSSSPSAGVTAKPVRVAKCRDGVGLVELDRPRPLEDHELLGGVRAGGAAANPLELRRELLAQEGPDREAHEFRELEPCLLVPEVALQDREVLGPELRDLLLNGFALVCFLARAVRVATSKNAPAGGPVAEVLVFSVVY